MEPKQVGENLQVELAVVRITLDASSFIVSSENLSQIILELAANISRILGGKLISVMPKFSATPTTTQHSRTATASTTVITAVSTTETQVRTSARVMSTPLTTPGVATLAPGGPGKVAASKAGSNSGVIGGVVVAVLVIAIMVIGLAVWYFR